ncbi:RseA family anti-sigma factor [Candidatus Hartigia pinicola]
MEKYHLIRDTLRNELSNFINFNIRKAFLTTIDNELMIIYPRVISESQLKVIK